MGVYLGKANTKKETEHGEGKNIKWAVSAMQGWRINMEDAHLAKTDIAPDVHLFGVFDGHGGAEVARFCGAKFAETLVADKNFTEGNYEEALKNTFLKMDQLILSPEGQEALKKFKLDVENTNSYAGCTANVCLLTPKKIYCANAGDSRAILYTTTGTVIDLSTDHKPEKEPEKSRIQAAGGYVRDGRINDNLNLSRAIGDFEYKKNTDLPPEKQIITALPDVKVEELGSNIKLLVMGCDGIWETLSAKAICESLSGRLGEANLTVGMGEVLDKLVAKDTSDGVGCDNMSMIVVQFI